ncbi:hypothetical protein BC829DRAFT_423030 [Chytridium lagenaria]|nr:hypothetical protein BC829DRAFT_423030 [Chytridium lagenaria]
MVSLDDVALMLCMNLAQLAIVLEESYFSTSNRMYLTVDDLADPDTMPWFNLYESARINVEGFLSVTGLDRPTFDMLLVHFEEYYEVSSGPGRSGRPRKLLEKSTVLGMVLHFYVGKV